ncbi:MAG TPA: MgtC/SapB family protein [Bradyrhizobium sp.]|nr:MgtC/SapB family protein [Bradyrhizobium sp.]
MEPLVAYWSLPELATNGLLLLHLGGATLVGLLLGYERSYHGRAAGMRTYALVCIASTMLTAINGFPGQWYGGLAATPSVADPTRVIQGIMTGIGFLGAGVIMKDGFTIRGLSTAASIWVTAAIGVLIGIGFYGAAISATLVTLASMTGLGELERLLPHQSTLHLALVYPCDKVPTTEEVRAQMKRHGFDIIDWSFHYCEDKKQFQYDLVLQAFGPCQSHNLVNDMSGTRDIVEFRLAPSRA